MAVTNNLQAIQGQVLAGRRIDTGESQAIGVNSDGSIQVTSAISTAYDLLLDDTSTANTTYVGEAIIGTLVSAPLWRIKRIDETTGLKIGWAGGNTNFDKIWNDRLTLIYSQ